MSMRYHRGGTYQTRNPLAVASPLRSMPTFRHPATVFGASWDDGTWNQPKAAPLPETRAVAVAAPVDPSRELLNAAAGLREAQRVYDAAREEIGEANRTRTEAMMVNGRVAMPARQFTPERMRERKSSAFRLFNKRRGQLAAAKRRLAAALAATE